MKYLDKIKSPADVKNLNEDDLPLLAQEIREVLDKISEYLYEHETITGKEFMKIFREIKGIPEPEEESGKKSFMEQAMDAERQSKGNDGE